MENPDVQAGADAGLPPPPPPPMDAAGAGLGSDPAEVLPPPPPPPPPYHLGGGPYDGAQGADGSAHPAEHASLNGTSGEPAGYQAAENGAAAAEMPEPMVPEQSYEDAAASAEEARLWDVVTADCLDFDAWTALIEETERIAESNILKIRKVYDAFLAEFPLCFGYWKKYADHEGRLDGVNKVCEVYERAVLAVTYSVDIWCNYCQFAISTYNDPDVIRRLFDRGLAYVGTDYRSNTLWDEYIKYEESLQAWSHLAVVYTRILEHPIQQLDRYFNCLKELTAARSLSEILTAEETSMYCLTVENSAQVLDGEAHPSDVEKTAEPELSSSTEAEYKAKYVSIREELYKKAKEYESKIINFEQAIRRPYFHVKPLDKPELENWHSYLDFIETEEDINKVIKLYERCVIACASYSEFWIRYVQCMEDRQSLELANNALARATHGYMYARPWSRVVDFYAELVRTGAGAQGLAELFRKDEKNHTINTIGEELLSSSEKQMSVKSSKGRGGRWERANFKIVLSYHGGSFDGWQKQPGLNTVQGLVEKHLGQFVDERKAKQLQERSLPVEGYATVAGRTDKGVTALQQVCSFYTWRKDVQPGVIKDTINEAAPDKIKSLVVSEVSREFHPNFSAKWRRYLYIFPLDEDAKPIPGDELSSMILENPEYKAPRSFDVAKVDKIIRQLEGKMLSYKIFARDTQASRSDGPAAECFMFHSRAAVTKLYSADENCKEGATVMCIELVANRFLRKMVRVLVATTIREAAAGADEDALLNLMDATCRRATAPPAPAEGLCLVDVGYEDFDEQRCFIVD